MTASPVSVLVIENHPLMRSALCAAIADEPDLAIAAVTANGNDILTTVEALHPDIILLGLSDPGTQELKTLKVLRSKLPAASILALTSNDVPEQAQASLECGAHATLSQNAPRNELLRVLRQLPVARH